MTANISPAESSSISHIQPKANDNNNNNLLYGKSFNFKSNAVGERTFMENNNFEYRPELTIAQTCNHLLDYLLRLL